MEFRHKEALRKSRIYLLENVIFEDLLDHVIDQDIFSDSMLDHIKAGGNQVEQIRRLLDYLSKRPDSCFNKFIAALNNSGHEHCVKKIQEEYVKSGPTQASSDPNLNPATVEVNSSIPVQPGNFYYPGDDDPMEGMRNGADPDEMYSSLSVQPPSQTNMYAFAETGSSSMSSLPSFPVQESGAGSQSSHSNVAYSKFSGITLSGSSLSYSSESAVGVRSAFTTSPSGDVLTEYQLQMSNTPRNVYRMESTPRGLVLVINNEQFKSMSARPGSKIDQISLHHMFQLLGFELSHEDNKTAEEMMGLLKKFSTYPKLRGVDALAVVILSHGGREGVIYGKDGSHKDGHALHYITDEMIQDVFSARNCPLMANKPKLIIIQACRGRNEDMPDGSAPKPTPLPTASQFQKDNSPLSSNSSFQSGSSRTANMADMCLIHSTVQGYVSYRHPQNGSPFVEELTAVFKEKGHRESLIDMMTEVNQRLATRQLPEDLRTVPSSTNTLTKKWFFNPPFAERITAQVH